jgi:hypothetical protein
MNAGSISSSSIPSWKGLKDDVLDTIRKGSRRQYAIDPHKYKYLYPVEDLPFG